MKEKLLQLNPTRLWNYFYELSQIPRPSKKETEVVRYVKTTGEQLGLSTQVDDIGNIIIKKAATPGFENKKGVILQSHVDMVPQKNSDTQHDFEKDPISLMMEGDWLTADRTTLGADNGIGVAAMLAVLESQSLQHGPLEALFTVDEETGMSGAFALKPGLLNGEILLNLDSEDEGELFVGCAGGMDAAARMIYTPVPVTDDFTQLHFALTGLKGGHSGLDIHLGRGNANKLLARVIKPLLKDCDARICQFNGGTLRNAIPRESFAQIAIPVAAKNQAMQIAKREIDKIKLELQQKEPTLELKIEHQAEKAATSADPAFSKKFVNLIYASPNGVIRMSDAMPGVVETSINLAIATLNDGAAELNYLLRSSSDSAKKDLAAAMESVFELSGELVKLSGEYPGWQPNPESDILKVMIDTYAKKFKQKPAVKAIHAGLECGILGATYPNWDMISFGPTIRFPHSPDEKVHIPSVDNFWNLLLETLKNIPEKT